MTCTKIFLDCFFNQKELLLCGYSRLHNVSYEIPLDVVQICYIFLPCSVIIPQLLISDESDTDDSEADHLCEDEITERESMWQYDLFGKYEFIKTLKFNHPFTSCQYQSKLLSQYTNKYYSLNSGTNVIIKKIKNISKQTLKELQILNTLTYHPHIQTLYDIILPRDSYNKYFSSLTLIMEHANNNLSQILQSNQLLHDIQIKYILYQILLAIKYIHSSNIIHSNLTPENILIAEDCSVKICNFKHSVSATKEKQQKRSENGLFLTRKRKLKRSKRRNSCHRMAGKGCDAPELILNLNTKTKPAVDIWAVGIIFAELLQMQQINKDSHARRPLFARYFHGDFDAMQEKCNELMAIFQVIGSPEMEQINNIKDVEVRECLKKLPQFKLNKKKFERKYCRRRSVNAMDMLTKLLCFDANKRICVGDALEHSYLENIRNPIYEKLICKQEKKSVYVEEHTKYEDLKECILAEVMKYK